MQVVSQKFCAQVSSMSIIDSKKWTLGPLFVLSVFRFNNIQNYGDPVLIVRPYQSLIGVCRICPHYSIPSQAAFGRFMIGDHNSCPWLQRQLPCVFILISLDWGIFMKHLVHVQCCKWLYFSLHSCLRIHLLCHADILLVLLEECLEI